MKKLKKSLSLLKTLSNNWARHNASMMASAIAFKAMLSIVPIFVILIAIAQIFFGSESHFATEVFATLTAIVGENGAVAIQAIATEKSNNSHLFVAFVATLFVIYSSSTVLLELVISLDTIWDIPHNHSKFYKLKKRLVAMSIVVLVGAILIAIKVIDTVMGVIQSHDILEIPSNWELFRSISQYAKLPITIGVFAAIFKTLPTTYIQWKDVALASFITTFLVGIGQFVMDWYFSTTTFFSVYGAAGTLIVFMLWVYYNTLIILLGAELSKIYTYTKGSRKKQRS